MDRILYLAREKNPADSLHQLVGKSLPTLEVKSVTTEVEFSMSLESKIYLAVIFDSSFPGLDEMQAMQLVDEKQPLTPVIVLTDSTEEERAILTLERGAFDYIDRRELWRLYFSLRRVMAERIAQERHQAVRTITQVPDLLIRTIQSLSLARSINEVAEIVRYAARRLVGADGATFVLKQGQFCYYADEDAIEPLWKGRRFPLDLCISGWVMENKEQLALPDIYLDSRVPHDAYRPTFVKSLVMTPVRQAAPVAAIGTYWSTNHHAELEELEHLQVLADSTALAIENVCLYNELEQRAFDRTNQLRLANTELQSFTHAVSHDLREPLAGIYSLVDLTLAEIQDDPEKLQVTAKESLNNIRRETQRLMNMVSDLLRLSQISNAELSCNRVDLSLLADDSFARVSKKYKHHIAVKISPGMEVDADSGLLSVVLENLLSNACKYSSKVALPQIEVGDESKPGDKMQILYVRDNGAGFDMARARDLFGVFKRLHQNAEFPGTGVGLATVRRIIHKHGGEIWAESTPGAGACFYFSLPRSVVEPTEQSSNWNSVFEPTLDSTED